MTDLNTQTDTSNEMTAEEARYFETGGVETPPPSEPEAPAPETLNPVQDDEVTDEDDQSRDSRGRFVPHQALHQERAERKKAQQELENIRQKQAILEDRWNTLLAVKGDQQKPVDDTPPDPDQDIFAFSKWQADQLRQLQEKVTGREQQETQSRQQAAEEAAIWSDWQTSATSYAQENPTFNDAAVHLATARDKQLEAMANLYPQFANKAARDQQMNAELRDIIATAKKSGVNPAEAVYNLATNGYGFQAQAPDNGAMKLPDALAKVQAGQNASRTLASSGGRSQADPMSAEAIANMSENDFKEFIKDPANAKRFEQMLRN